MEPKVPKDIQAEIDGPTSGIPKLASDKNRSDTSSHN